MRLHFVFYFIFLMVAELLAIVYVTSKDTVDQDALGVIWLWFLTYITILVGGIVIIENQPT